MNALWKAKTADGRYQNPILFADYSDPDVIRVGSDYFMVASSFTYVPGVPVLHSTNLVDWERIGYCVKELPFERYNRPAHGAGRPKNLSGPHYNTDRRPCTSGEGKSH